MPTNTKNTFPSRFASNRMDKFKKESTELRSGSGKKKDGPMTAKASIMRPESVALNKGAK